MKKRMRYYLRRGWVCIELPTDEINVFHFLKDPNYDLSQTYHNMVSWCKRMFKESDWHSGLGGGSGNPNVNRFVFRNQRDATLFALKWVKE